MPANRLLERNVRIYDGKDRVTTLLDDLILSNGVQAIKTNFYSMIKKILLLQSFFFIQDNITATLERNEESLLRDKLSTFLPITRFREDDNECILYEIMPTSSYLYRMRNDSMRS